MKKSKIFLFILCCIVLGSCADKTTIVWLDDLEIKTFSDGIPGIAAKNITNGDSIKMRGTYFD